MVMIELLKKLRRNKMNQEKIENGLYKIYYKNDRDQNRHAFIKKMGNKWYMYNISEITTIETTHKTKKEALLELSGYAVL